ncbi:MAG: UbiH/UbiF family hydroxylase [Pseudomonadota bacterium]
MAGSREHVFDAMVVGGGLAGLTAACLLDQSLPETASIALVAPTRPDDRRTTALLQPSVDALKSCGVWEKCEARTAPLRTMRIIDGTNRLIRAPMVDFKSLELDLDAFGYNVENRVLAKHLLDQIAGSNRVRCFESLAAEVGIRETGLSIKLEDGTRLSTPVAIAADGRKSLLRQAAPISTRTWSYPQWALVTNFTHTIDHQDISTEFHTETGPFTLVPLPKSSDGKPQSSLVWVANQTIKSELEGTDEKELSKVIERKMQSMLGKISISGGRQIFPLSGMTATSFAKNRILLAGEAAHVFPPIGAQGLNLGIADAVEACKLITDALNAGRDPGDASLLSTYSRRRGAEIIARTGAVDLLNRSLLGSFLPIQAARSSGLYLLSQSSVLRCFAMKSGLGQLSRSDFNPFRKAG